ncbi:nuclear transport factor 2 family protein [Thalassobius vesicularis]|uniref:Nuclear transport factor 2 family protein n=1 Tax=Thalassobius vesicularis TaxID=1294297 RepID=A0A4S3MB86_9RHOB|nr:nuclear transport factor 2 family protein [Thalassobius vesicularis]THD75857.1 nuclear transport factor 2 family protein [Thalassobius vesicularis]
MTQVIRSSDCENSPRNQRVEQIALALLGAGDLPDSVLSEGAVWDRNGGAISGRAAIQTLRATLPRCEEIRVDQVVSHGKAGTASGTLRRPGQRDRLFCHVIRFTSTAASEIAQIVSFEHAGGAHGR